MTICSLNVLTNFQLETLMKTSKVLKRERRTILTLYRLLLSEYKYLCEKCQNKIIGSDVVEILTLEVMEKFADHLGECMLFIDKSHELKNCLTLMLCHVQRCNNISSWIPQGLNRCFLNWMSHRASNMGHAYLGILEGEYSGINRRHLSKECDIIINNSIAKMKATETEQVIYERINLAMRCYKVDYNIRKDRCPEIEGNSSICGEKRDASHIDRRILAQEFNLKLELYLTQGSLENREEDEGDDDDENLIN